MKLKEDKRQRPFLFDNDSVKINDNKINKRYIALYNKYMAFIEEASKDDSFLSTSELSDLRSLTDQMNDSLQTIQSCTKILNNTQNEKLLIGKAKRLIVSEMDKIDDMLKEAQVLLGGKTR